MQIGLGVLGVAPHVFWRMSLKEFREAQRGFFERQKGELRQRWETARFISFNTLTPHLKKGKHLKLHDIALFEWEKSETKIPDKNEMDYMMRKFGKYIDENGNYHN